MKRKRNRNRKQTWVWPVAVLVTVIVLFGFGVAATAAEDTSGGSSYIAKDGYVYHFGEGSGITVVPYPQFSNYVPIVSYDNADHEGYSIIFGLYDTYNDKKFEKLYCMDMPVDAEDTGINYRPLNLSDSTYAAALANRLRGIVLNTYPYIAVDALEEKSGITGLTRDEAITGSQLAIWKTTHGDNLKIKDFGMRTRGEVHSGTTSVSVDIQKRIEALYNYLIGLPEQDATKTVVSEASFVQRDTEPTRTQNKDGTYNVTVKATVDVQIEDDDSLTLAAHMGDGAYYAQTALSNGSKEYTLTIENVPADVANGTVTLAIDGTQKLNDVYLVDAEGIRGASQSMIGALDDTVAVHAETKVEPDRVLELYKQTNDKLPLAGISFDVYYVGSLDDFCNGRLGLGEFPTDADMKKYAKSENLVGTLTTDSNGYASLNFGTTDGVYLIKELPDERVEGPCEPFFVVLPYEYENVNDDNPYTLTVYPKNELKTGGIELVKVDADNFDKKLAGATFEVYRKATFDEIATDENNQLPKLTIGKDEYSMVRVSFYNNAQMAGEKVDSLTTGADGKGSIYGIAYGDYYLVETEAPAGYHKLTEPIPFTVTTTVDGNVDVLTVENSSGTKLPETGGMGTAFFLVVGVSLMVLSGGAMLCRKRRN